MAATSSTLRRGRASSPPRCSTAASASRASTRAPTCWRGRAARFDGRHVELVESSADAIPFPDESFDHLTFTYLLRYVDDAGATLTELARVVRPGGVVAMLEFGLPRGIWRPPWNLWVDVGLPVAGRLISPGWHEVGRFLGPSIRGFHERYPEPALLDLWRAAGIGDLRVRRASLGGGLLVWGRRGAG